MEINNRADISTFESLFSQQQPASGRDCGGIVQVANVDISLQDLVKYSNNNELNALYEQLVRYGTELKADTMLRGYRPKSLGELIDLLRQGLNATPHGQEDAVLMDEAMLRTQKALVDRWARDGEDLRDILKKTLKQRSQYNRDRRYGLFGWLPGRAKKREKANVDYENASRLARLLQDRMASEATQK